MTRPDDDDLARFLVDRASDPAPGGGSGPSGPCLDDQQLAAFAEGRLEGRALDEVLAHLVACAPCRYVVEAVAHAPQPLSAAPAAASGPAVARPLSALRWIPFAAAATLLVGLGLASGLFSAGPAGVPTSGPLAVAFAELSARHPALFDAPPLTAHELEAGGAAPMRGGVALHGPTGLVLDARPTYRFTPPAGASSSTVTLYDEAGRAIWTRPARGDALPHPTDVAPLAPGTAYAWSVAATGVLGRTEGRGAFRLATADEAARWTATVAAVEADVAPATRALVLAHAALRAGLLEEALRRAELAQGGSEPGLARATWALARRRLGYEGAAGPGTPGGPR